MLRLCRLTLLLAVCLTPALAHAMDCGTPQLLKTWRMGALYAGSRPSFANTMDSTTLPIRVHYAPGDETEATTVLTAAEVSWRALQDMGFDLPLLDSGGAARGGSTDLDIYIEVSGAGGYFSPETTNGSTARADLSGWLSINPDAYALAELPSVVAHEMTHASQMAMDYQEDYAFLEATATWSMDQIYPTLNLAKYFVPVFQQNSDLSLDYFDYGAPYQYGSSLYFFFLSDVVWNTNDIVPYLWQATIQNESSGINEPDFLDALDDALRDVMGQTLQQNYAQFAWTRLFTGSYDNGTFEYGNTYGNVLIDRVLSLADLPVDASPTRPPAEFGASYIAVSTRDAEKGAWLDITFSGGGGKSWEARVLGFNQGNVERHDTIDLSIGTLRIDGLEQYEEVLLVVANLGDGSHDPDNDDWTPSSYTYAVSYGAPEPQGDDDDDGNALDATGCDCRLAPTRGQRLPLGSIALLLAALLAVRLNRGIRRG